MWQASSDEAAEALERLARQVQAAREMAEIEGTSFEGGLPESGVPMSREKQQELLEHESELGLKRRRVEPDEEDRQWHRWGTWSRSCSCA